MYIFLIHYSQMFRSVIEHESFPSVLPVQQGNSRRNNNRAKEGDPRMVSGRSNFFRFISLPLYIYTKDVQVRGHEAANNVLRQGTRSGCR